MSAPGVAAWRRVSLAAGATVAWRRSVVVPREVLSLPTSCRAASGRSLAVEVGRVAACHNRAGLGIGTHVAFGSRCSGAPFTMPLQGYGAQRSLARPPYGQGGGGEIRKNRGDEPSLIVTNVTKGERLKLKDYWELKDKQALFIKDDGSKVEMTVLQVVEEAAEQGLDAVMVTGQTGQGTPVLKLMDVNRARHDLQKKKRESSKKSTSGQQALKELRFGLNIDSGDLKTKMKQATSFLEKGHRIKIFMQLKGADYHRNQSQALVRLAEIAELIGDAGTQDAKPVITGHVVSTYIIPKPTGSSNSSSSSGGGKKQKLAVKEKLDQASLVGACTPEEVAKQGDKVRAMKEALSRDPQAHSKSELEHEIERLKALKDRLEKAAGSAPSST